ncbi:mannitol/fructose-specific phosphotransferase system IIA component (Ntr-type) [Haloferula luteola]|uniref:Mannitol/fructose-specific phosphotransferase system IIA component (Ntr-type) n=1 Tax=Haloferula luteola TaxID=595692 RepID=A0A840V5K4_9BACT|nr:PTS sugar transporter subunit IIA [Haloferula luteola]MBB5352913.1 mannitol/fructose-specific phosphotransferase system IIA component (Ntr-type) [Haloferula luteola]
MLIGALCPSLPVALDLDAGSEEAVIRQVAGMLAEHPGVKDPARFVEAVLARQKVQPPLLGGGVALPHARCGAVTQIVAAAARVPEPVDFHGVPVQLVFLFGVPPHAVTEYLEMTAELARRLRDPRRRQALLEAEDPETFRCELGLS